MHFERTYKLQECWFEVEGKRKLQLSVECVANAKRDIVKGKSRCVDKANLNSGSINENRPFWVGLNIEKFGVIVIFFTYTSVPISSQ